MPRADVDELEEPEDHNLRLAHARACAQWEIGDRTWADVLLEAYFVGWVHPDALD